MFSLFTKAGLLYKTFKIVFLRFILTIYDMRIPGVQGVTRCDKRLPRVTLGYKGLQGLTRGYRRLKGVTEGYKELQWVTRGDRGLQGLQWVTTGDRGLQGVTGGCKG